MSATLLLDTHSFIWSVLEPERLSGTARDALTDSTNRVQVSAVSFWEMSIKAALGKLTLSGCTPEDLAEAARVQRFDLLPLDPLIAARFFQLPVVPAHRDPFDRMLVWQALETGATLVSRDGRLSGHAPEGLRVLW